MNIDFNKLADEVARMRTLNLQRVVLHTPESTLNIMIVRISRIAEKTLPHKNVNRDEYFSVLDGAVLYEKHSDLNGEFFSQEKIQVNPFLFTHVPANTFHNIAAEGSDAFIHEIIGGKFESGSTIYFQK